nr:MAG TPA: hypothetical protein [Caudoviricetes sp.]
MVAIICLQSLIKAIKNQALIQIFVLRAYGQYFVG